MMTNKIGLRIDVDTYKGTKIGVPNLLNLLAKYKIKASFFFSVGPDNMGRHLWRLYRPNFFGKIWRTKALSLYGLDILLSGTMWSGKKIAKNLGYVIKKTLDEGHEIGLHAWDHYSWQAHVEKWPLSKLVEQIKLGVDALEDVIGTAVKCSAVAGWRSNELVLIAKEQFKFDYNSDCRGTHPFRPILYDSSTTTGAIQIPVTLPIYDEVIGRLIKEEQFNHFIIKEMQANTNLKNIETETGTSVYAIHAEIEGISKLLQFANLLEQMILNKMIFCTLREIISEKKDSLPKGKIIRSFFPGREGWLGCQGCVE